MVKKGFQPWRASRKKAIKYFILAAITVVVIVLSPQVEIQIFSVFLLGVLIMFGIENLKRAKARKYGMEFEDNVATRAQKLLERSGLKVERNKRLYKGGDVDLMVWQDTSPTIIEIKSFRKWGGSWKNRKREKAAIGQVISQLERVRCKRAAIWLPSAKPGLRQWIFGFRRLSSNIYLIKGSEYWLRKFF